MFLLPPEPQTVWLAAVSLRARKHAATSCGRRTKECWWFWDLCTTINVFPTKSVGGGWLKKKNPTLLLETFEVRGGESRSERRREDSVPAADGMEISGGQILPPRVVKQRVERGHSFKRCQLTWWNDLKEQLGGKKQWKCSRASELTDGICLFNPHNHSGLTLGWNNSQLKLIVVATDKSNGH